MAPGLTSLFSAPFFTGTDTVNNVPGEFPVAIAGHTYMIDLAQYKRRTLPALRPPQDTGAEPGENSLNTEGFWRRTQTDWSLGAGQMFYDDEQSSRRRFYTSKGIDPWTPLALSLHYDTALRESSTDTNLKTLSVNGYFYFVEGSTLKHTTDPSASSPTWTTVTTTGLTTITGLATDGSTVYVCDNAKVMQGTVGGGSVANLGALAPKYLFFCNGRLIYMKADVVAEMVAAGTKTDIKDHDNSSFVWNAACGAPNGIYLAGNSGDRNEVYYVGVSSSTGALTAAVHAMSLPVGETLNCIEHDAASDSFITLGTSKGFRIAQIREDNGLSYGPLVEITGGVQDFDARGKFVYFTYKNYDSTSTGVGRMNLAEFTEPLVPAYATDLMATTQGEVQSISNFGDKVYFAVSGAGLYGQTTTKVASGTVTSGWIRYGTSERKVVSSIDLRHDSMPAGGSIQVRVDADNGDMASTQASSTTSSLGPAAPLAVGTFTAEMFRVVTTIARATDTTTGPTLRRWTSRALALPFRTEEIIVPLMLSSLVESDVGEGADYYYDPYEEWLYLKGLESSRNVVRYQEGSGSYSVYVDGVEIRPTSWVEGHDFFQGIVLVRLLTVESTS